MLQTGLVFKGGPTAENYKKCCALACSITTYLELLGELQV